MKSAFHSGTVYNAGTGTSTTATRYRPAAPAGTIGQKRNSGNGGKSGGDADELPSGGSLPPAVREGRR